MKKRASKSDSIIRDDWNCEACGARVVIRRGENSAYYWCDGRADDAQCGHRAYFGAMPSRKLTEAAAAAKQKGLDNVETQQTPVTATANPEPVAAGNDPGNSGAANPSGYRAPWDW